VDTVQFIANIKDHENVESAIKKLCLQPLEQRKRTRRVDLLVKILAKEEQYLALSSAYDDLLNKLTNSLDEWVLTVPSTGTVFSLGLSGI